VVELEHIQKLLVPTEAGGSLPALDVVPALAAGQLGGVPVAGSS